VVCVEFELGITHCMKLALLSLTVCNDPYPDSHDEQDSSIGLV
jgi:hypothetical protein